MMAIWLVRAGRHGEHENKFLEDGRIYITYDLLDINISELSERSKLVEIMTTRYPDQKTKAILNQVSQLWPFAHEMKKGDLVVMPLKSQRSIQIGEITGDYRFEPKGPSPFFHWRSVKWLDEPVPRSHFAQDLLYSFGAFMTICRIQRNNAEERIMNMRNSGWKPETIASITQGSPTEQAYEDTEAGTDLEERALDQIARLITARFKGHALTRLVEGILKAQGYTTYRSPEGPDGAVDILAGAAPLGFGKPRLCVEVKSEHGPVDRPTVDKLLGAITKFQADEGLFVAWNGFKSNVQRDLSQSFFRIRLWSQKDVLEALFAHYDRMDDDLKAELPLKRIWTVATPEE